MRTAVIALWLCVVSSPSQAMQGFDPNAGPVPDFELTPFYDADLGFATKSPGEVLKTEAIPAPDGALAWRVMYVSRTWDDRLVPATGIIVAPKGPASRPRPILTWLHGTTGGARAARRLADTHAGRDLLTFGWSQGGHAGLFIAEEQPAYAPEFHHRGTVAIAPGNTAGVRFVNIPHAYVLARGYAAAYYVPLTGYTDEGRKLIDVAGDVSITGVFRESLKYRGPFFTGDWNPTMRAALALNIPANRKSPAPILVVHGTADEIALPIGTKDILARALKSGDTIKVSWYQNENHRSVIAAARREILAWFDDRLKGRPAPRD